LIQSNPEGGGSLLSAVDWVASVLLGSAATTVAVLAVASLGFLMLSGRVPLRRGVSVILGCFILFSAGGVASALLAVTSREGGLVAEPAPVPEAAYTPAVPEAEPYDPYSGAAVPDQGSEDLID
jgi:type IV secretory pathway VirB2 component (pilin)